MKNILLVTSSPRGKASFSTQMAEELVEKFRSLSPDATVTLRDLDHSPLPYLSESLIQALHTPEGDRTEAQASAVVESDALIAELREADTIVIASGLINFGIPATLKSWIDHVTRSGITFRYTEAGPEGLLTGKKTYLVLAYGGVYSVGPMQSADFQGPYLKWMLGFLGLTDIEEVIVEGSVFGPEAAEQALGRAHERVEALAGATF
ncbi:FMN-dependent NADH-azoreductase [bacterium]|nr:MAG: FMN-dependent NADH-azoreductase [bacterium]